MSTFGGVVITTNTSHSGNITMTTTRYQLEDVEASIMLHRLNNEKAMMYLPVIVYMLVLMLVGTFGNILVCCVYYSKPTKTSSHYFILSLAVFDLLTCVIGMPTEVTDLRFPYMFYAPVACKILRFIESVSTIGSSIILIAVAFDRYFRICRLGKQMTSKTTKIICIVAIVIGMLTSWPACILFGQKTIDIDAYPEIHAVDCSTDDSMRGTIYPTLYYGFLFLLFIMCLTFFTVIYTKIGRVIWKRKKARIGENANGSYKDSSFNENTPSDQVSSDPVSADMSSDGNWNDKRMSSGSHLAFRKRSSSRHEIRVTRTTVVLFAVTVAYVISFLPFLVVMVLRNVISDFEENLTPEEEVVYKFCSKSYFINNAINPVIYSFLNVNFRKDTKTIFRKCLSACCCCRRSEE